MQHRAVMVVVVWWYLSALAFGQEGVPKQQNDAHLFLEAVKLSYDGDHAGAREKLLAYKKAHPDDLLSSLRMFYDRLFDVHSSKMDEKSYQALLGDVNNAITIFNGKGCSGTDLQGITGNTLDCEYVGAALYSFREVLRIKNEGVFKTGRGDDDKFFLHAQHSTSLQAGFLIGVHEYQLSTKWFGERWLLNRNGIHTDQHDAIQHIIRSLADQSPFADDVWFFVLRLEIKKEEGAGDFARQYPSQGIIARLKPKYPDNRIFRDSSDSFEELP